MFGKVTDKGVKGGRYSWWMFKFHQKRTPQVLPTGSLV